MDRTDDRITGSPASPEPASTERERDDDTDGGVGRVPPAESWALEAHRRLVAARAAVRAHVRRRLAERGPVARVGIAGLREVSVSLRVPGSADARPAPRFPEETEWAVSAYYAGPTLQHTPCFY